MKGLIKKFPNDIMIQVCNEDTNNFLLLLRNCIYT